VSYVNIGYGFVMDFNILLLATFKFVFSYNPLSVLNCILIVLCSDVVTVGETPTEVLLVAS